MEHKSSKYDNHDKRKNSNKTYFDLAPKRVEIEETTR